MKLRVAALGLVPLAFLATAHADPEIFAPGVISGLSNNLAPAFSPDCKTVFFGRSNGTDNVILVSTWNGHSWTKPKLAPFSGVWRDLEPTFSPDGKRLIFASNRPRQTGGKALDGNWGGKPMPESGGNLWSVERRGAGWSDPEHLGDAINGDSTIFSPSVTTSGTVYFMKPTADTGRFHIYRSELHEGQLAAAERLPWNTDERWSDVDPTVAPDESFVVFSSNRAPVPAGDMDLYIVFKKGSGWSEPKNLGPSANSLSGEIEARLGPDDHTLYFSSRRIAPITYPRSAADAAKSVAEMESWGSGLQHIWRVDIATALAEAGLKPVGAACTPK